MNNELSAQLHRLYRDFYARRLAFDDYRSRRAVLLDSLLDVQEAAPAAVNDTTTPRQQSVAADHAKPGRPEPETGDAPGRRSGLRSYYLPGAGVVAVVAVALIVMGRLDGTSEEPVRPVAAGAGSDPAQGEETAAVVEQQPDSADRPPAVGQRLVEAFVARDDWRRASVTEFQDSWKQLPETDRFDARRMVWFEPMAESLTYQIEEILEFSENPDDDQQLKVLYELALNVGLAELVPLGWMPDPKEATQVASRTEERTPPAEPVALDVPEDDAGQLAEAPVQEAVSAAAEDAEPPEDATSPQIADAQAGNDRACAQAQLQTRRRNCIDVLADGSNGPPMRVLPAGDFVMGTEGAESGPRQVAIAMPFAMSLFEVRFSEFARFCAAMNSTCPANPWGDDDMPVVNVSRAEATAYAAWLTEETGVRYRLPTEEEWEYAARAGTATDYPYGDELLPAQARYSSITAYDSPLPASDRTTQRNEFGLWHVVGNVREWVAGSSPVVRGGSYAGNADDLRSWERQVLPSAGGDEQTGFRILREL